MPELRKGIFLKGGQHPGRGVSLAGIYSILKKQNSINKGRNFGLQLF
jgi:hypothetical protein